MRFTNEEGDSKDLPIENIEEIYFMSEITLNISFLNIVSQNGIVLHFFNYYRFYPKEKLLSGQLLVRQVGYYTDSKKRLVLAKKFIQAASANIYRNLRYYNGRGTNAAGY